MGGNHQRTTTMGEGAQILEAKVEAGSKPVLRPFDEQTLGIYNQLVVWTGGIVGQTRKIAEKLGSKIEGCLGSGEEAEDMDFFPGAGLHAEEGDEALPAAAFLEGWGIEGAVMVSEGKKVDALLPGKPSQDRGGLFRRTTGRKTGVVVKVREDPYSARHFGHHEEASLTKAEPQGVARGIFAIRTGATTTSLMFVTWESAAQNIISI